jgi:hypothetical protein
VCYVRVVGVAGTIHHVVDVVALSRSDRGPIIWTLVPMTTQCSSNGG